MIIFITGMTVAVETSTERKRELINGHVPSFNAMSLTLSWLMLLQILPRQLQLFQMDHPLAVAKTRTDWELKEESG